MNVQQPTLGSIPVIAGNSSAAVTSTFSCRGDECLPPASMRLSVGSGIRLVTTYRLPSEGSIFHTSAPQEEVTDSSAAWGRQQILKKRERSKVKVEVGNHARTLSPAE